MRKLRQGDIKKPVREITFGKEQSQNLGPGRLTTEPTTSLAGHLRAWAGKEG